MIKLAWPGNSRRGTVFLCFVLLCLTTPVLALIWAPYLPRLAVEGYPQLSWPAPGSYALVRGGGGDAGNIVTDFEGSKFDPRGRQLFDANEGAALLIFHAGRLRFEHYAKGVGPTSRFNSYSMVKSLVGALVLRAHADGLIQSLNDPIGKYLDTLSDADLRSIPTIEFLRMTTGIAFESDGLKTTVGEGSKDIESMRLNPFGPMARLHMLGLDAIAAKLTTQPSNRGRYNYQNVNTAILGRLLAAVYDRPLEQVLSEKIWMPAGASTAHWRRYGPGRAVSPYCCLYATPRDWLRVGRFLANNGTGKGTFLPQPLWRRFMGRDLAPDSIKYGHYGLHIYRNVLDRQGEALQGAFSYMFGSRGQVVYLMPDRDLVVVRIGGQVQLLHSTLYAAWRSIPH